MEALLGALVVAAAISAIIWNHRNADAAMEGVEFEVAATPPAVLAAIRGAYCGGAKAKVKTLVSGVSVREIDGRVFRHGTKLGDEGKIEVRSSGEARTVVKAHTTELYVGTHPTSHFRSGFYHVAARVAHVIFKMLGIAPNAARMKRFQQGIEGRIANQLRSVAA